MQGINPFTAPACKISGLKDARTLLCMFRSYIISTFSAMHLDENPFACQYEKKKEEKKKKKEEEKA